MPFIVLPNGEELLANVQPDAIKSYVVDANNEVIGQIVIVHY